MISAAALAMKKLEELFLLNYMAIFLLHELYGGKGNTLQTRYYIKIRFSFRVHKSIVSRYALKENHKMLQHSTA